MLNISRKIFYTILVVLFFLLQFPEKIFVSANSEFVPTHVEVLVSCGNGIIEFVNFEVCDKGTPPDIAEDLASTTCSNFNDVFGNPFQSGALGCASDCLSFDTEDCYTCGNTHKEKQEQCDHSDFGSSSCITLGYESGSLVCTPGCQISSINCVAMSTEGGTPGGGSTPSGGGGGTRGGSSGISPGFNPGAETQLETKVVVRGKSFPNSDVHILVDGVVVGIVKTDPQANFYFETSDITPGIANFGFWSEDLGGLKSTLLTLTLRVISGAVTTISGVYISPSIDVDKKTVKKGEVVTIFGQTVPDSNVKVHVNSPQEFIQQTSSLVDGRWELAFDTDPLEEDFHTAKAYFEVEAQGNVIKSGFSKLVSFYVGKEGSGPPCPEGDLNKDGRVNITDFSIMLFHWGTNNSCADQNQNGTVDLIDFSIMMYYWTG